MSYFDSNSGDSGVAFIILGVIGVSILVTLITGGVSHWLLTIASIIVGLWAVAAING